MSDNEYEKFEITDYDLDNEFNINRPRRRPTKHQQIYGIWADDSENESEEESSNRRGRRGRTGAGKSSAGKPKDYTAPVSFVAGGIQQSGKKNKKKDSKQDNEDHENPITDEEEDERPSFGHKQPQLMDTADSQGSSASSDESDKKTPPQRSGFGMQPKKHATGHKNVGAWEQHTRGIGAKLLLQMGYKPGKGLGKDLQGISQPVEAHVRKGRGAIGAYGPETAASIGGKGVKPKEDEDVREAKEFKEQLNKWKKGDARQDKTKRYYYKSVEEVIEKGKKTSFMLPEKLSKKLGNVPVIDMTGPEKRVLSGYHALTTSKVLDEDLYDLQPAASTAKKSSSFALPELMHNLTLIVDNCEREIIVLDSSARVASDRQQALENERNNLEEIVKLERNHIDTLEVVERLVTELTDSETQLTLERAEKIFLELQSKYAAEYQEFGLGDLSAGVIAPIVKSTLDTWQPLAEPTRHIDMIKKWRGILDNCTTAVGQALNETRNIFDPYSSLIWAGVIPSFRACSSSWNPKQHQRMAALLDSWAPLFPSWILDSVLEQLILPRLTAAVKEWDPLTDTVPIHIWILPWTSILGHKMEELIFPTIREKLGNALLAWMPQDRSARAMLTPWKGAFDEAEMQSFLMQHIIPKLQLVLNEFIINPLQQDLELWNQVWEWHELVPPMHMALLLDKYFFPKWMQVLVLWLNQSPDYVEISRWYSGWKSMFSAEILQEPNVKEHLRRALEIMHRATETPTATPPLHIPTATGIPTMPMSSSPPPPPPSMLNFQMPPQLEFKELVSQKCSELGILFAPMPGRRELGKQVYRVGKLFCYIDRNVILISDSSCSNWAPTSLPKMLESSVTGIP